MCDKHYRYRIKHMTREDSGQLTCWRLQHAKPLANISHLAC